MYAAAGKYNSSVTLYRRAYDRVKMDELAVLFADGKEEAVALRNISPKGMGVELNRPLLPQEKYKILFRSAILREFTRKEVRVAWCKESQDRMWGVGLELGPDDVMEFK